MKLRQILAWVGIILLVAMYVVTLVFSLMKGELAVQLFNASAFVTIVVPIILYGFALFEKHRKSNEEEEQK